MQKLMAKVNANEGLITDLKSQLLMANKVGFFVSSFNFERGIVRARSTLLFLLYTASLAPLLHTI